MKVDEMNYYYCSSFKHSFDGIIFLLIICYNQSKNFFPLQWKEIIES